MAGVRFDPREFAAALAPRLVLALEETASTNDEALRIAREGGPHGSVVVADVQRAGRGRLGRGWWAPPGSALLASWVARPRLPAERWSVVPLLAGLAAADAIEGATGLAVRLKWPNDLVRDGRKLGGVLCEAESGRFVVVGLGVNVGAVDFPPELAAAATTVEAEAGRPASRPELLAEVLRRFDDSLDAVDEALERYRGRSATIGGAVRVERLAAPAVEGLAVAIDAAGALVVETSQGRVAVPSGDVQHLRPRVAS